MNLNTIEEGISSFKNAKPVIIVDDENRRELIQKGYQSTPVTLIRSGGDATYVVGFNFKKLAEVSS